MVGGGVGDQGGRGSGGQAFRGGRGGGQAGRGGRGGGQVGRAGRFTGLEDRLHCRPPT